MSASPLDDFGKDVSYASAKLRKEGAEGRIYRKEASPSPSLDSEFVRTIIQWSVVGNEDFLPGRATARKLPAGMYTLEQTLSGPKFCKRQVNVDGILEFPNSVSDEILREIGVFWERKKRFHDYGFLHRRGYLLYGPQGSGKSILVQQVVKKVIERDQIVILCNVDPELLDNGLRVLRDIEPDRHIVCIFEDIDAYINEHGEDKLLAFLDGESQLDDVLNIATTNYPERLDKRLISRPRRFDRLVYIGFPDKETREFYLKEKLKINVEKAKEWSTLTEGFSFAALADLVITVECLGGTLENTLQHLRSLMTAKRSSSQFEESTVGFWSK